VTAEPRWATPRTPGRRTYGPRVADVAAALGYELMPHQRLIADVALEVGEDGRLARRQVVVTMPRQQGKTVLELAVMTHRALGFGGGQQILYLAQSRLAARKKWEDDHVRALARAPFRQHHRIRLQYGMESIRWDNRSTHAIGAPTETATHGEVLDLLVADEAFAHTDDRVEQAAGPAMLTRPQPQTWIVSTAGGPKSTWLRSKVEQGRAMVDAGTDGTAAYFEWSADPDADPGDPATWAACMPALGRTHGEDPVRAAYESMRLSEFRRGYLNAWGDEAVEGWRLIDKDMWEASAV
jgi:phage terminase large subunit-like protein